MFTVAETMRILTRLPVTKDLYYNKSRVQMNPSQMILLCMKLDTQNGASMMDICSVLQQQAVIPGEYPAAGGQRF